MYFLLMHTTKWPTMYTCTSSTYSLNNARDIDIVVALYCLDASYPLTEMQTPFTTNLDPPILLFTWSICIYFGPSGPYISETFM